MSLGDMPQYLNVPIPQAAYADGGVDLDLQRTVAGDSLVSEVALEENTRLENGRYPAPSAPTPTATPAPTTPAGTIPQVVLPVFTAVWNGSQVDLHWETTTEIDHSSFKVYRSTDTTLWTEIASVDSTRACGNYTATTPVSYAYNDTAVVTGTTYYYRLQFSGEDCGGSTALSLKMATAAPTTIDLDPPLVTGIVRVNGDPTNAASVAYTVTFSEEVTGVDSDFALALTGAIAGASITDVTGSGASYTVTVNTGSGNGILRLDVLDDDTIMDLAGNPLEMGYSGGEV